MVHSLSRRVVAAVVAASVAGALVPASAWAAGVDPDKATPAQREQAQARFLRGKELYAKGKYAEAYEEFHASMEIVESPNTRLSMARALREMGKLVAAYVEFGRTAVEAQELTVYDPRYKKAGESAIAERNELAKKLGFVVVTVEHPSDDTKLTVGGEEVRRGGWGEPFPVMPGQTEVVVETPGKPPVTKSVTVGAGGKESLTIDAAGGKVETPPPPPPTPEVPVESSDRSALRPWAFVAGGVGVVGLLTFTIAGLKANSVYNDLKNSCGAGPCPSSKADDVSSGKSYQAVANIGLVIGVVGVAAGVTLFVLSRPKSSSEPSAQVTMTPTGFSLQGAF
jgi:hypothetical protein